MRHKLISIKFLLPQIKSSQVCWCPQPTPVNESCRPKETLEALRTDSANKTSLASKWLTFQSTNKNLVTFIRHSKRHQLYNKPATNFVKLFKKRWAEGAWKGGFERTDAGGNVHRAFSRFWLAFWLIYKKFKFRKFSTNGERFLNFFDAPILCPSLFFVRSN